MIDWHKKAERLGQTEIVIDGEKAVARAMPAAVLRRIAEAYPEPGVPTDDNGEKMWQEDGYRGRVARHRQDMVVLEAAAMLGFTTRSGLAMACDSTLEQAAAWVKEAIAVFGAAMSFVDCHTVVMMVHGATSRIGEAAKNSSSSSPSGAGSTSPPSDSPPDAPSST